MHEGNLFSRSYLQRGKPTQDSQRFRNRIAAFYWKEIHDYYKEEVRKNLELEAGIKFPYVSNVGYSFSKFCEAGDLVDILDSITVIYRTLSKRGASGERWKEFIAAILREENLQYSIDDKCGVHYYVDEEFEWNRSATLSILNEPELQGVQVAFSEAFNHMDKTPPDTKAAVRSIFEAIEIFVKQLLDTKNLNKWVLENTLKEYLLSSCADSTEKKVASEMLDGFGRWIDGLHNYRHGQGEESPVAPSEILAVYTLSSGSAFLRWIVTMSKNSNKPT